jgi:hypothetical protein
VRLLSIRRPASFDSLPASSPDAKFDLVLSELRDIKDEFRRSARNSRYNGSGHQPFFRAARPIGPSEATLLAVQWLRGLYPELSQPEALRVLVQSCNSLNLNTKELVEMIMAGKIGVLGPVKVFVSGWQSRSVAG